MFIPLPPGLAELSHSTLQRRVGPVLQISLLTCKFWNDELFFRYDDMRGVFCSLLSDVLNC